MTPSLRPRAPHLSAVLATLAAFAAPLQAQSAPAAEIGVGEQVRGEITKADPLLSDDSHYDAWHLHGARGQRVEIVLESDDFDAYLIVATERDPEGDQVGTNDDDAGGTNARLSLTLDRDDYWIFANTLGASQTGRYTLRVSAAAAAAPVAKRDLMMLTSDRVIGSLTDGDPLLEDDSYYDDYGYQARAGERVVFDLESAAFDAVLSLGRMRDGEFEQIEMDDDGGGGTNSRISFLFPEAGVYVVRANSLSSKETGSYTLRVTREGAKTAPARQRPSERTGTVNRAALRDGGPRAAVAL